MRDIIVLPKRSFLSEAISENPVLKDRELIVVYDEDWVGYKVGNGESKFNELPFIEKISDLAPYFINRAPGYQIKIDMLPKKDNYCEET